jgi:hypothetical protein
MVTNLSQAARAVLLRRGFRLEYATLAWNAVGIVVLAVAAILARSVALAGFGLDSLIEVTPRQRGGRTRAGNAAAPGDRGSRLARISAVCGFGSPWTSAVGGARTDPRRPHDWMIPLMV